MKNCFFITFANNFEHINSDVNNLVLITLKLDFLSLTTSLKI